MRGFGRKGLVMALNISKIQRFSLHDGPGIRTTVFLKGCNLSCLWCHNPETISALPQLQFFEHKCIVCGRCVQTCPRSLIFECGGKISLNREGCAADKCGRCAEGCPSNALVVVGESIEIDDLLEKVLRDKSFYESSGGGVTLSGGEPLLQADAAAEFLVLCKANGIHTTIDTAGCVDYGCFERVLEFTDLFLYDIKIMDSEKHLAYTGQGNELILDNFAKLAKTGKEIVVRVPVIAGVNDNADEDCLRGKFLAGFDPRPTVEYLPTHAMARGKYESLGMTSRF